MIDFYKFCQILNEASRWKSSSWKPPKIDAVERLKKYNRVGYYCHFTDSKKIGINPQTQWTDYTPYGVYAYTVKYALEKKVINLPFGNDKEYIWVFRAKNPKKIKKINSKQDKAALLYLSGANNSATVSQMAVWFLSKGIEGFIDNGTSTIHPHEPYQAVFFGSQTIIPIDFFRNSMSATYGQLDKDYAYDDEYDDYDDLDYDDDDEDPIQTAYGKSPW